MPISNNILAGSGQSSGDLGETIEQSLRFSSSGYLTRAQLSSGDGLVSNTRTFTFSTWFKHGDMGETNIFGIHLSGSNNNWLLNWNNYNAQGLPGTFGARDYTGHQIFTSNSLFRDPSAWYHLFLTCSSGVLSLRVNNVLQNQTATQNHSMDRDFWIGSEQGGSTPMDAYLAETYFIQNAVLHPVNDGFIRLNGDGVYVPDTPTISSYGTNGFYLKYDSAGVAGGTGDGAGIGADHSGNGNHFTASNFDTAAISSSNFDNDIDYEDTPTNNTATLNPLVRTYNTLSEANLKWDQSSTNDQYFSVASMRMDQPTYGEMVALENTNGSYPSWGVCNEFKATNVYQGYDIGGAGIATDPNSAHYLRTGGRYVKGTYSSPGNLGGPTFAAGDIVRWTFNPNNGECRVAVNGGSFFTWHTFSTSEVEDEGYKYFCAAACNTSGAVNFGNRPFVYSIPTGFSALQTNNLSEPTIKNGSEHCRVLTGTGANIFGIATGTNTNGTNWNSEVNTGFTDGLYWIKDVSVANEWQVIDTVRGTSNVLLCPTNANETTYTAPSNTSIAYCWKGGGTAVSNTNGSITSSVSANTDAGFSIATYTGTGAAATIGHGLTQAPDFIITRVRNDSGLYWTFYHSSMGNGYGYMNYNLAYQVGASMYQGTSNTTWTLDGNGNVNSSGQGHVSYLWHNVPGYSKFGIYESNTVAEGPFVYLGFRPALILIKNADSTNQWQWINTTRDPYNSNNMHTLTPQTTAYEAVGSDIDILSNGFKIRDTSGNFNYGGTFLYCAWAENPFGGENTPPATAR